MSFLSGAKAKGAVSNARPAPATANKPAAPVKQAPRAGRYAGLSAAKLRTDYLTAGRYRVKVISTTDYDGDAQDWFYADLEILSASEDATCKVGETRKYSQCVTKGNALRVGGPKVISFVMAAMGYETEADFRAAFPEDSQANADLMNRVSGVELDETDIGPNPLAGSIVLVQASGTNKFSDKDGTEFHNYAWYPDEPDAA